MMETTMNDRCEACGAKNESHHKDHLCRMHRDGDGVCTVCGNIVKRCIFSLQGA